MKIKANIIRYLFLLSFFLFTSLVASALPRMGDDVVKGQISGKITDSVTNTAVSYATISIFKAGAPSPFNGVVSDDNGAFVLNNIAEGQYRIVIDFIGYRKKTIDNIIISKTAARISLGTIAIVPVQNNLKTVEIVS